MQESPSKLGSTGTDAVTKDFSNLEQEQKLNIQGAAADMRDGKTVKTITKLESTEGSREAGNGKKAANGIAQHKTAVSLSGAVTLPDVKALLREWTSTFQSKLAQILLHLKYFMLF